MTYYAWIAIFAIIVYIIVSDRNVADAFVYIFDITKNRIIRQIWWLKNNPRNPVVKYLMHRRSEKLARELMDEYENK
jgi:DNA modification methylase